MENELIGKNTLSNKNVLITGGNGFIGANLTEKLLEIGAKVTIITNNLEEDWQEKNKITGNIKILIGDITSKKDVDAAVVEQDYVFHLAGLSGAVESNSRPFLDLEVNCKGSLNILEACRQSTKIKGVLFTSSQLVYGSVDKTPVTEDFPTDPTSIYGIHKLAIEKYFALYNNLFGLKTKVLRISNPYGPRQSMDHTYGIVNYFIGLTLKGQPINIYGDGSQIRDYIYIGDLIEAMILTITNDTCDGKIYNIGGPEEHSLTNMAETIINVVKNGSIKHIPWPAEAKKAEIGDIFLSKEKLLNDTNWTPKTSLIEGIEKTLSYYHE